MSIGLADSAPAIGESDPLTPSHCPVCGASQFRVVCRGVRDFEYGTPGNYSWVRCSDCDLIRLDPFPTPELLNRAYPSDYHTFVPARSRLTNLLRRHNTRRLAAMIRKRIQPGARVLDVGCSRGELLTELGPQFMPFGVESHPDAVRIARSAGIHIWSCFFEDAEIEDHSMDVVLMWHVLEHVVNPVAVMEKVRRILKPGGIVLGELPNYRSWDAAWFGRYWGGGHAPRHLWHFTPSTLTQTLTTAGLEAVRIRPALHPGHFALSIQTLLRGGRDDTDGLVSGRSPYFPILSLALLPVALLQMPGVRSGVMRFEGRKHDG